MRTRLASTLPAVVSASLLPLGLLAVLLAACAPQAATETSPAPPAVATVVAQPSATLLVELPSPTAEAAASEALAATAPAVATSRGPNLHATDPSTVNLASGQVQLVEFFRFT